MLRRLILSTVTAMILFAAPALAEGFTKAPMTDAATSTATAPAAVVVPEHPKRFDVKDVFGKVITADSLDGWVVVYGFGNEQNAETAVGWLKQIALANPNADGIIYIIVADASTYSRVLQPMVKKVLKREYKKHIEEIKKKMVEKNIKFTFELEDRYILVADTKAEIFDLFGLSGAKNQPHLVITDTTHTVRGHFTEYSDAIPALITKVLDERKGKAAALKTTRNKRNMLPRYGAAAVLLWLVFK